ncbi:MAG TPA: hypothetical protein VHD84_01355 [Candidatus Saccharimonadales bacterium]|nr:hypothetical protein [Candidatus Saccharimonadales bacterium]
MKHKGFAHILIILALVWLCIAVASGVFVYRELHQPKPYAAPADASKLPQRP